MKFKKLVESFGSENKMTIRVASGLNADGCDILVTAADGSVLHKEEYRYGYNASHNRKWAEWYPEKPYMKDIIDGLCAKYDIAKSDIIFKCGANVFAGCEVTDAAVREFKNNYVESLTETYWIDSTDVMAKVDELGKELEADGFKYYGDRYSGSTYYNFFTKRGDNGAICKAVQYNYDGAQIIDVTVDQLMGYKPIDTFEKMRRKLGNILLPKDESFEMSVGCDDFDGEIAAMRAEQQERDARKAARKERFALMHKLFDTHMDAEPDANWVDKVYHIFDTAESTTFVGGKCGTIPGRTEDKQPIRYRFSIKEYDFYTDPYWEIVYIATNNIDPLKEDLEDDFDLYMKASDFKCKLSRYDVEEAANPDELIIYMEDVYNILADEYGAENIKWWKFYEDDDVDFGYKVCLKDGSKHIVEINNDRVDEINEAVVQESADANPQYVICGVTNDGCRMLYDAVNDNFTTDYDSATKYDDMEVARDDWFKIPRSGFRRIFIPVYDPAIFECVTEAFDADRVQKRVACTTEFDNGHVFHNDYFRASSAEAEERAKQASIENPDKVFYVKYDDVMNPSSDIKWKNGEQLNEADEPIYFDPDDEFEVDFRYYVYGNEDDVVSDSFDFEEDAIQWAKENNYPIVKIHNYYRDTDGQLNPEGDPEVIWHA